LVGGNEYIVGRELLAAYIEKLPRTNSHFMQAMNATIHFGQCIASTCQAMLLFNRVVELAKLQEH
jgi:hypothetical protein